MLLAAWILGAFLACGFALVIGELAFVGLALVWLIVSRPFVLLWNSLGANAPALVRRVTE
jgi:hypothetical protein